MSSKVWDYIVLTVVVIGAINWGLIGFFKFDLVSWLFGSMSLLTRIIYAIVGLEIGRASCRERVYTIV